MKTRFSIKLFNNRNLCFTKDININKKVIKF